MAAILAIAMMAHNVVTLWSIPRVSGHHQPLKTSVNWGVVNFTFTTPPPEVSSPALDAQTVQLASEYPHGLNFDELYKRLEALENEKAERDTKKRRKREQREKEQRKRKEHEGEQCQEKQDISAFSPDFWKALSSEKEEQQDIPPFSLEDASLSKLLMNPSAEQECTGPACLCYDGFGICG